VQQLGATSYSRARESAADMLALQVLACRYGHVDGATEFFEALRARDADALPGSHYFMSHPAMGARIDAIQAAARKAGYRTGPVLPVAP
jgi:predicted Zn-dependent protease